MTQFLIFNSNDLIVFNKSLLLESYKNGLLKDAHIFARLFKLVDTEFKDEDMFRDKNGYITLCKFLNIEFEEWNIFLNFLKFGFVENDSRYINIINILSTISNKFGGIPSIDKYYKEQIYDFNNMNEELKNIEKIYNPMTPEEDTKQEYHWIVSWDSQNYLDYSVTSKTGSDNSKFYFRKKITQ